jgi:ketosteroid isomerase-like protein
MTRRTPTPAVSLGGSPDEVEAAFFEALHNADADAMMTCWADEDEIFCIHPGAGRVVGPVDVRLAFEGLFAHGAVRATPEQVRKVTFLDSAVHSVLVRIDVMTQDGPRQAYVLATNVFQRTVLGWRMVAHHASPGTVADMQDMASSKALLH